MPPYQECTPGVKSELACPLIVQGRIVGVLNAEADTAEAFDDQHALVLFLLAATAALGIRQVGLWRDIHQIIQQQHRLLNASSSEGIFKSILDLLGDLGYAHSRIWDYNEGGRWIYPTRSNIADGDVDMCAPRDEGFTRHVMLKGRPMALTNFNKGGGVTDFCSRYYAAIDSETKFFNGWQPWKRQDGEPEIKPSGNLIESIQKGQVLTDLAFPIYGSGAEDCVRAVLWAKCKRNFTAILDDECWSLSVLCGNATEALQSLELRKEQLSIELAAARKLLDYQFGSVLGDKLASLDHNKRNEFLHVKDKPVPLIVLNIDIRGSTGLGSQLASTGDSELYLNFISRYHERVRKIILDKRGVFDKTMGDGVMALWPIFDGLGYDDMFASLPKSRGLVIDAVVQIFEAFAMTCDEMAPQLSHIGFPSDFSLGAAVVEGEAFVGALALKEGLPASFSALGPAANLAGKLVGRARRKELSDHLQNANLRPSSTILTKAPDGSYSRRKIAEEDQFRAAVDTSIPSWRQNILLVSANKGLPVEPNSFEDVLLTKWKKVWCFPGLDVSCLLPE